MLFKMPTADMSYLLPVCDKISTETKSKGSFGKLLSFDIAIIQVHDQWRANLIEQALNELRTVISTLGVTCDISCILDTHREPTLSSVMD